MKNNKKNILTKSLIAGAVLTTTALTGNAESLFNFNELGSGSSVRTTLLQNASNVSSFIADMKCGDSTATKASDDKSKDAKCGEGKCGDKKAVKHSKKDSAHHSKSGDAKCGEGKCGDKKSK